MSRRVPSSVSMTTAQRVRWSRGSVDRQTTQSHPICGTPKLVPVPRNRRRMPASVRGHGHDTNLSTAHAPHMPHTVSTFRRLVVPRYVERHTGGDQHAIALGDQSEIEGLAERHRHHVVIAACGRHEPRDHAPDE
jgi:hypothetical protein